MEEPLLRWLPTVKDTATDRFGLAKTRYGGWVLWAALVVVVGVTGSMLGSQAVARSDSQRSQQASVTSSVEIASTLKLAIKREQDLAVNTAAFIIDNPGASEAQFRQWVSTDRLFERFPELIGVGNVVLVPASQLSQFAARSEAASGTGAGTFQVTPPGYRPYYCFATLTQSPSGRATSPPNLDVCATALGPSFIKARDSDQSVYIPYGTGKASDLAVGTAIYKDGVVPPTVQSRRDALVGWVGIQVNPHIILATALQGHPDTAVAFRYGSGKTAATLKAGSAPAGAHATTVDLHNGWRVQVSAPASGTGVFANANALAILLGGLLLSVLMGVLMYVLATSRTRALALVRERTDELRHQTLHDSLTGLPNRTLILDRIEQMLTRGRRENTPVAALFLDLDDFKQINDTLGHAAGDELLIAVGARVTSALRDGDTVGRLGGDEFVVLAEGASLTGGAEAVAGRILDVLSGPFEVSASPVPLSVTASIGFAEGDRPSPGRLLQDADIALYQAKGAGKDRAMSFTPDMRAAIDGHRNLELDLHGALEAEQFFLVYQPTVELSTGLFTGVEALLRWRHPERGVVMPDEFIPALESSGLIIPVGAWVLQEACRQSVLWAQMGHRLVVSVNVSATQLERDRIIDDVDRALSETGLDPHLLILELTETALMNNVEASVIRLRLLKALGVRIAIDDFGTGYSSMAYLRQFPIDVLKIDQTFVAGMADSPESAALVHTLVQLGVVLGLETVAEGIETDEQRRLLKDEGVNIGQGYLFARPLEVEELQRLLQTHEHRPTVHVA
jgi:diguanylate cyclase (GGDEF)-like protein